VVKHLKSVLGSGRLGVGRVLAGVRVKVSEMGAYFSREIGKAKTRGGGLIEEMRVITI